MNTINRTKLPPGPKAKFPLGHLFSLRKDTIGFLRKIAKEYGDIVPFRIGPMRMVLLNHPDYIKEVLTTQNGNFIKGRPLEMAKKLLGEGLLTSEGELHKRQSRAIQPAFHRKMIESYGVIMMECIERMMNGWEDGMEVDMKVEMTRLSLAIAGRTMFNEDLEQEATEIMEALDSATSLFGRVPIPFSEWLLKLPLPSTMKFKRAKARLDDTITRMIDIRRQNKLENGDLLSILLQSQGENGSKGAMSDQQVHDEALTLFLTAFDTTSNAFAWVWYLLSQNPEVEAELHEELDRVLQGRLPTVEDYPNLKFTRMVFGESIRIYPPSYVIVRQALEDFSLDKYTVPGGSLILLSPYLVHHDSRFHPDPEIFNPHAWGKHSHRQNSKYEYFPFSRGPRACIGESYAWMEAVLVLASVVQSWHVKLVPGHPVEFLQLVNLRPKYGMKMRLYRRE